MLKETIHSNITQAMKDGQDLVCSTLRMVSAAIISKEKEKRYKIVKHLSAQAGKPDLDESRLAKESQATDEEIIDVIASEIKKRKDAITLYEKGNRQELADKEKKEVEILQKYLPEQLSEEGIRGLVLEAIEKVIGKVPKLAEGEPGSRPQSGLGNMGRVMAELMPKIKGKADSGLVSKIVKDLLIPK